MNLPSLKECSASKLRKHQSYQVCIGSPFRSLDKRGRLSVKYKSVSAHVSMSFHSDKQMVLCNNRRIAVSIMSVESYYGMDADYTCITQKQCCNSHWHTLTKMKSSFQQCVLIVVRNRHVLAKTHNKTKEFPDWIDWPASFCSCSLLVFFQPLVVQIQRSCIKFIMIITSKFNELIS